MPAIPRSSMLSAGTRPMRVMAFARLRQRHDGFEFGMQFVDDRLGVAAGATTICHAAALKPGTPSSAIGARSGMAAARVFVVTPSARILPALISGTEDCKVGEHDLYSAAHQIDLSIHHRLVGHVHHLDAGHGAEQLGIEVERRPGTRRTIGQLAGMRLGVGDKLGHRMHRQIVVDHEDEWDRRNQRKRHEIFHRVVRADACTMWH